MHLMLSAVVILQLASTHFKMLENAFPKPQYFEYIWILSLVASIAGYLSLSRNRIKFLKFYYYGHVLFGLAPILFIMLFNASDLWDFVQKKTNNSTTSNSTSIPVIVIWYIFLFIAIQIHLFGIYFSRVLLKAWDSESSKNKNKKKS